MALFGKKKSDSAPPESVMRQAAPRKAYCRICNAEQVFSTCWERVGMLRRCTFCRCSFENPEKLYERHLPVCPACGEYLEHPTFLYGLCSGCGSKYELMPGAKPSLLPNRSQREAMEKHGKSWSNY